jgi:hypothetical protein
VLPWDRKTWIEERAMYLEQWRRVYAPPIKRVADE